MTTETINELNISGARPLVQTTVTTTLTRDGVPVTQSAPHVEKADAVKGNVTLTRETL